MVAIREYLHETKDGVTLRVSPVGSVTQALISQRVRQECPEPTPPMKPVENSAIPDDEMPDRNDPAYKTALTLHRAMFNLRLTVCLMMAAVTVTDEQAVIDAYSDYLQRISRSVELTGHIWEDTLIHGVLRHEDDRNAVVKIMNDKLNDDDVTQEGLEEKAGVFRYVGQRATHHTQDAPSSAE